MELKNKTIVVTGGGSGIGAQVGRYFANKEGAKVALWDINQEAATRVAMDISAMAVECDVTKEDSVKQALEFTSERLGTPHVLIQCAGILPAQKIIGKEGPADLDHFHTGLHVNLLGTFNVMRLVAYAMSQNAPVGDDQERGVIINTASIAAYEGQIGQVAYAATKGGVVSMTLPAARELSEHGIRVMTVAPGVVETPMIKGLPDKIQDALKAMVPFPKRLTQPSEYAALCQQIIENPMLNGSVIRLDGAVRLAAR